MLAKEDISIIVVDDLQFSCEVVKSGLKKSGYPDVRTANSANEAMHLIHQKRADVILADFWMPETNGLELADLIRRWDENNNRYTGIILLTAEDNPSSIVVAFEHGVDDFLSKSANQFELSARVYGAARSSQKYNELLKRNRKLFEQYQNYSHSSLMDMDTGLVNRAQLERTIEAMIAHCETRGGGLAVALIQLALPSTEEDEAPVKIPKGTLRSISHAIQLALRPLDLIARYNEHTFAIALTYAQQDNFQPDIFERSIASILKHNNQKTEHGRDLQVAMGFVIRQHFEPIPEVADILHEAEEELQPLDMAAQE